MSNPGCGIQTWSSFTWECTWNGNHQKASPQHCSENLSALYCTSWPCRWAGLESSWDPPGEHKPEVRRQQPVLHPACHSQRTQDLNPYSLILAQVYGPFFREYPRGLIAERIGPVNWPKLVNHRVTQPEVNCPVTKIPLTPSSCPVFHTRCYSAARPGPQDRAEQSQLHSPRGCVTTLTSAWGAMGSRQGMRHRSFHSQKGGCVLVPRWVSIVE